MDTVDSIRLELEAERHNHRKDNEHFMAEIERLRAAQDNPAMTIFQIKERAYDIVLRDLRSARDNIDRAIAAMEALHEPAARPQRQVNQ